MTEPQAAQAPGPAPDATLETIRATLEEIRPAVQFDGGDLSFVAWNPDTGIVAIEMHGACIGCSMSSVTLQAGIERILKDRVPDVKAVVNVGASG